MADTHNNAPFVVNRYALHSEIASGGMATIYVGRLMGPVGFSRTVAIKRLHSTFAKDPEFVAMFMDEARIASRVRHPNVASIVDVVANRGELLLVMEYIHGDSLSRLIRMEARSERRIAVDVAVRILVDALSGLHAAHEANSDGGHPLGLVHRDVSPQNILVGENGITHLIDFGIARAAGRIQSTREGQLKGKLAYMAPEQIRDGKVDRRADIYAAGIVLWEALVGRRAYRGSDAKVLFDVLSTGVPPPSTFAAGVPRSIDEIVMRAIQRDPSRRFGTALEMADALEDAIQPATQRQVARWIQDVAKTTLDKKARLVAEVEELTRQSLPPALSSDPDESDELDESLVGESVASRDSEPAGSHSADVRASVVVSGVSNGAAARPFSVVPRSSRVKLLAFAGGMFGLLAIGLVATLVTLEARRDNHAGRGSPVATGDSHEPARSTEVRPVDLASGESADAPPAAEFALAGGVDATPAESARPDPTSRAIHSQPNTSPEPAREIDLEDWRTRRKKSRGW